MKQHELAKALHVDSKGKRIVIARHIGALKRQAEA